ncbi:hypothetical protein HP438_04115 [Sphingomonas zeae]|uniref:Uncharacterized protein n=2 Tax=Sphingomonadaceae TaxID=41297 RepID=A0A7Y6B2N3_9SPHN|nr:hypothetical protein [Sphingomonas zeae]
MLLMGVGPPLTWLAILWSDPVASGVRGPLLYGLPALASVPGLTGLSMLPLRRRTKGLILPLYLTAVILSLLYTLVVFVCVATHDCP